MDEAYAYFGNAVCAGREHVADGEWVGETDIVVIEYVPVCLFPGGGVQMTVDKTDYQEEAVSVMTEEGLALLRDAGVDC